MTNSSSDARGHWVTMACPICGVGSKERCLDTMGHRHPSSHPERRVWSACEAQIRADAYEQAAKVAEGHPQIYERATDQAEGFAHGKVRIAIAIRALSDQPDSANEGLAELLLEARDWIHHKAGCAINDPGNYSGKCTCGSKQLWGRIDTALSTGTQT